MAAKRALVVDDSRSARAFLSRMLEKHDLEVDTAESAEDAIDYLTRHRPDVIFMDHLMPGMDGFQAVQAIKQDPRTATIPILMYTSQEGELYLGQARALGAIGVLPKQIRPADVFQVLRQLHLVDERRTTAAPAPVPAAPVVAEAVAGDSGPEDPTHVVRAIPSTSTTQTQPVLPAELAAPALEPLLRDQIADLRRALVARLDDRDAALGEKIREAVRGVIPPPIPLPPARPDRRGWGMAAAALLLALVFAFLWRDERAERRDVAQTLETLLARDAAAGLAVTPTAPQPAAAAPAEVAPPPAMPTSPVSLNVSFGELPLSGDRIPAVRAVLEDLRRRGFRGDVDIVIHQGRFCIVGNAGEGWSLAPEDLAHSRCDRVGNPVREDGGTSESVAFANMLAEQRRAAGSALRVRVVEFQDAPVTPYPDPVMARAGTWNAAAAANNRIEIRWRERP